jgi:hypothetical protein
MKKLAAIGMLFFIGMCFSCRQNDGLTQEEEAQNLRVLLSEIEVLATSESCVDASAWTYTSYGEKACGGPVGYIGYATSIDTVLFLQKVEAHRKAERAFNEKWGIISTCDTPQEPSGVVCENENPVFTYEN